MQLIDLKTEISRITTRVQLAPLAQKRAILHEEVSRLPEPPREAVLSIAATYIDVERQHTDIERERQSMARWEKIVMISSGGAFLVALLLFSMFIPYPTESQFFTFRVVLALAAAAFGCAIPGLLGIEYGKVRAGGALGLFVLIYIINPPKLISGTTTPPAPPGLVK